jgi:hypothetical protein
MQRYMRGCLPCRVLSTQCLLADIVGLLIHLLSVLACVLFQAARGKIMQNGSGSGMSWTQFVLTKSQDLLIDWLGTLILLDETCLTDLCM